MSTCANHQLGVENTPDQRKRRLPPRCRTAIGGPISRAEWNASDGATQFYTITTNPVEPLATAKLGGIAISSIQRPLFFCDATKIGNINGAAKATWAKDDGLSFSLYQNIDRNRRISKSTNHHGSRVPFHADDSCPTTEQTTGVAVFKSTGEREGSR